MSCFNSILRQLTIDLDQNVDFLFPSRVLGHQCVLASVVAVDFIDDKRGGRVGDFNESSVVEVDTKLTPSDGGSGATGDFYKQAKGATSTQADGLLQVIMEIKVRSFCERDGYN